MDPNNQPDSNIKDNLTSDNSEVSKPVVSVITDDKSSENIEKMPEKVATTKPTKKRKWPKIIFYLAFATIIGAGFWQRQNIIDWYLLRDYKAPQNISQLADQSYLSDYGRKLFYLNRPQVQSKNNFYISCEKGETAVVLGCYIPNKGIFLLEVTDSRLDGVEQVTAAHEMLHFAYGRLSYSKKIEINRLVKETYSKLNNENITKKINIYKKSGADVNNELHSILGTEVKDLPPELSNYYSQFFKDRTKVVELSDKFQSEFTARKLRVIELDKQLTSIESQVYTNNKNLDDLEKSINAEKSRLDQLLKNGEIDEYNDGVASYNLSLIPYRTLLYQTRNLITEYKNILTERNQVAAEAQELNKALDSRLTTTNGEL